MSTDTPRARHYPQMPPALEGETDGEYTDPAPARHAHPARQHVARRGLT